MINIPPGRVNFFDFDPDALDAFLGGIGEKPFRSAQLLKWVYQRGVTDFGSMSDLSKSLRDRLGSLSLFAVPSIVADQISKDGTRKWLLRLSDGNCIETVFIPESDRGTLCISSQVGCILNCSFCSTAQQGFNRNLSSGEIIVQLWLAAKLLGQFANTSPGERIVTNVVLMGMGEPLLNFDNVISAIQIMLNDNAFGLSRRRITLSTAGVIPGIERLQNSAGVSLAISLHATNNKLRDQLVPLNKKYPIEELLDACRKYSDEKLSRKITFEYILLKDVNDSVQHARELVTLLRGIPSKVNLIPFNPFPLGKYERSGKTQIDRFYDVLYRAGLTTITRRTRGDDIDAACGQLAGKIRDRTRRTQKIAFVNPTNT